MRWALGGQALAVVNKLGLRTLSVILMSERLSLLADHIDPNSPYAKFDDKSSKPGRHVFQRYKGPIHHFA